ncbi:hypothetical protein D3C76_1288210 [compost metagenome]
MEQRIREAFINLRLGAALGTQEITCVQPGRFQALLLQNGCHQTGRPHFTVAHHFGIDGVGDAAVEQTGQPLQILDKGANQAIGHVGRQ